MNKSVIDTNDLRERAAAMQVALDPHQLEQFATFAHLLREWNERLNLTAVPPGEYVERHFLDCLALTTSQSWSGAASLADVGTGAGFPGIPLKIAFPRLKLTLIESLQKRCNFLSEVVGALDLTDVTIVTERGEICAHSPQLREKFDFVSARAVATLSTLVEILLPFARVGGKLILLKGNEIEQELAGAHDAAAICGGSAIHTTPVTLPHSQRLVTVVEIEKLAATPPKFPRSFVAISKRPLQRVKS